MDTPKAITRCKTGQRLHLKWSQAVQNATMQTWQQIMFGPRAYDKHVLKCKKCAAIKALREEK